ncbi:MAG: response regulator transcription factor [Pseudomonadota bacterium]
MSLENGVAIIVDDDRAVRQSLEALLSSAGIATRSHADGHTLLEAGLPDGPACVLLDLDLAGESGIQIQQSLRTIDSGLPVIFLTGTAEVSSAVMALKGGAVDFFEKGAFRLDELVSCVLSALKEHRLHLQNRERQQALEEKILELSRREREVALLVARGRANKSIAAELGISDRTVEIHRSNAMRKLQLRTVTGLAHMVDALKAAEQKS